MSSFVPKKKSFSQGRRGEWKDLSFGHIISSHHLQRELEGNKHFTFINFINLLLFSKRQQQVARIEAWSSRKFLFYYCRRQKLPIGSEIRLLCQRAQDDCRVHIHWHQSTMLQKLSRCEVKAWLCWNLIILPSIRFYVKSNFGRFKKPKNVILDNFRGSECWFLVNLSNFQIQNLPKFKVQSLKLPKMTFLDGLN